ncbi:MULTISPECIES: glutamine amidotransferase-related protein [Actinomyces]|uniref:Gamma-glutamyl-gamma-aminobutyrate hydrolase family protein n=1 Tax=Actinomyces respiraculi TaxID=2744574 RepID=A0A7T0LIV3_9ACTO|nr:MULTISPECIES: gamma-glutamyl-gamma-aminobutyrate hydrolase family protein [Actinomyces]QPL04576.1 gamma-glutamyl-gamma-aminobutyrate hydrolase family protein [Actinomyces respiraculi]
MSAPFLLAVCRRPGAIADDEITFLDQQTGLTPGRGLDVIRLLDDDCPEPDTLDLSSWAGVLITGSPLSLTGPLSADPAHERLRERVLALSLRLVQEDVPTLGLCFGLQSIVLALGGSLRDDVGEELQAPVMTLTDTGAEDPLTAPLAPSFRAYVGHSHSVTSLPGGGVVLATGAHCPIQMGRWGRHVYGTQFHPEITTAGMRIRIDTYGDAYYPAHERAAVIERCDAADVRPANRIVSGFVQRYREDTP